jgi:subtilisin family serine protease
MKPRKLFRATLFCLLILTGLFLMMFTSSPRSDAQVGLGTGQLADWRDKVDSRVLSAAALGQTEFLVYMKEQADLSGAAALATKDEKGQYVYERLTAVAQITQPRVKHTLALLGAEHKAFWVSNTIWAKGNLAVVQAVALLPEVANVYPSGTGALKLPPQKEATTSANRSEAPSSPNLVTADANPETNLTQVNADDVWNMGYLGQGVTVAGADTGVRWTHAALKPQYRGWDGANADHNYNWHDAIHASDPANLCPPSSTQPCDDDNLLGGGHGSHTVGTIAGDDGANNRIGMAPQAKWMACRNMERGVGAVPTYLECMEWFIAPTKIDGTSPDPTKAPHVINNSWGCVEGCPPEPNPLRDTLQASRAAGIFYAVSAGNDGDANQVGIGPSVLVCNSIQHPLARYPEAFTVGATDHRNDMIANFSSRGPAAADPENPNSPLYLKPNITAPGVGIRSAQRANDNQYGSLDGTSMAGPHVAGLVALLISANPNLAGKIDRLEDIIEQTAVPKTTNEGCGLDSNTAVPNNTYGYGRIDALAAVLDALPPIAIDDTATTSVNAPVQINVLANDTDPDGDTLTVTAVSDPAGGSAINNGDGTVTYTPDNGFTGTDTFTYTICAPEGCAIASDTATVTVNVQGTVGSLVNYALASLGSLPTASSEYVNGGYPASSAIDGEHKGLNWGNNGGWNDSTRDIWPDSLEVAFPNDLAKTITEIRVYTVQNDVRNPVEPIPSTMADLYGIADFQVQTWNGSGWVTVPGGTVTGNDKAMRVVTLATPIATTKIRVLVTAGRSYWTRIVEVEAFGAAGQ